MPRPSGHMPWLSATLWQSLVPQCGCLLLNECRSRLQVIVERLESEMKDINSNSEALKRNFLDLTELRHILSKTHNFFEEVNIT